MHEGIDTLTEKEREALRLIVRGHDAKSMARTLDLSVHTINDRLRAARRKFSVTSSKEAARLLLAEEVPENLGHKELGGDTAQEREKERTVPTEYRGEPQSGLDLSVLLGGIVLMTTLALIAAALLQGSTPSAVADNGPVETTKLERAESFARDATKFIDDDSVFDPSLPANAPVDDPDFEAWNKLVERRLEFGKATAREAQRIDIVNRQGSDEWIVRFRTDFERLKGAYEKVVLMESDDGAFAMKDYEVE